MTSSFRVAVIGAGASGIMAAIKTREAGIEDVTVFEKAPDLGGTWFYNRYPGLACDVPSHAYRYSFAPNPDWSQTFSPGSEIHAYLKDVAKRFGVEPLIRYNSEIVEAELIGNRWHLTSSQGPEGEFDAVISAVGILHKPVFPDIPGLDSFAGESMHTSQWCNEVELDGKKVGIIGTGSTSTQLVCATVDQVERLTVFQRTPQWIFPLANGPIPEEQKALFRSDPALLQAEYDRLNYEGNYKFAAAVVGQRPTAYAKLERMCKEHLETGVSDPELRARLTPDYPVGCKRLVMSDQFYSAIQRPNAELVTEGIDRIEPAGIRTRDGRLHELDVLVLATGFDPFYFFGSTRIVGQNGVELSEAWADSNEGYLGVSIPGFPNWFMIGGPNSPLGNFAWLLTAEMQCEYILQLIELVRAEKAKLVAPSKAASDAFNAALKEAMTSTVWTAGCRSWYIDKNGNVASWPYTYDKFIEFMRAPVLEDFEIA